MWLQDFKRTLNKSGYKFLLLLIQLLVHSINSALGEKRYILPMFENSDQNITAHIGDTAVLPCKVVNLGDATVIWKKMTDPHPISVGEFRFVGDPSYRVSHVKQTGEWHLEIDNVKPHHSGVYECQISAKEDIVRFVQLNVLNTPNTKRKAFIKMSGNEYVDRGEPIILKCNATGATYPPEDVDWFKDGDKIRPDIQMGVFITKFRSMETKTLYSTLEIKRSDLKHRGLYLCRSSDLVITKLKVVVLNSETKNKKRGTFPKDDTEKYGNPARTQDTGSTGISVNQNSHSFVVIINYIVSCALVYFMWNNR